MDKERDSILAQLERTVTERQDRLFRFAYMRIGNRTDAEEFLMLNVKNASNPKLRDCYAAAWQPDKDGQDMVTGKLFVVTSRRPDLPVEYTGTVEWTTNTPKDGKFEKKLKAYQDMLSNIDNHIFDLENNHANKAFTAKRLKELYKQMDKIMDKMNELIIMDNHNFSE